MPDFVIRDVPETPYLYVSGATGLAPEDVSAGMGAAFDELFAFLAEKGITPVGPPLAAYHDFTMDETMRFRAGVAVAPGALSRATGRVAADTLPAGRVLSFVHVGPYETLRDDYAQMMRHVAEEGLDIKPPSFELYIDDMRDVAQDRLRTECCTYLA